MAAPIRLSVGCGSGSSAAGESADTQVSGPARAGGPRGAARLNQVVVLNELRGENSGLFNRSGERERVEGPNGWVITLQRLSEPALNKSDENLLHPGFDGGLFRGLVQDNIMKRTFLVALMAWVAVHAAVAEDFATTVMDATFKFFHPDSTSTCFLVRRERPDRACYLVTTAHTLERTKGPTGVLVLREPKPDGSYERNDLTITIRRGDQPLWVRHEAQDVAVLRLTERLPRSVTPLPESVIADEVKLQHAGVHICSPLFILTYPARFEANSAGFPVARHGIFASPPMLPLATYPTFLADFTTFAGDSGGPVFMEGTDGHPLIVGIVVAQTSEEDKMKSEYEERVVRHPLGMGTILHAKYVLDTLEEAAKRPAADPQ